MLTLFVCVWGGGGRVWGVCGVCGGMCVYVLFGGSNVIQWSNSQTLVPGSLFHLIMIEIMICGSKVMHMSNSQTLVMGSVLPLDHDGDQHLMSVVI